MDPLLKTALLGTGKAPGPLPPAGSAVDPLLAGLPDASPERRLLLAAGARAVHRLAGRRASPGPSSPPPPAPAAAETRPACSPGFAATVARILGGEHRGLLPEACERLAAAGWRLPETLLPAALAARECEEREALRPVLGERGRWLAGLRHEWRWVHRIGVAAETPEEQRRLWDEGSFEDRAAVLRRVRAVDSTRGREWLAPVLPKEKADERTALVLVLETGLSADDEALLEKALDDRSSAVRAAAAGLLARLPSSAFGARQRRRAEALLTFEAASGGFFSKVASLVTGRGAGKLTVVPPQEIDKSWERDGIPANPPAGVGKRAFWLAHVLSLVPPDHWSTRFGAAPDSLVAAGGAAGEWSGALLEGWARAAVRFRDAAWAAALWDAGRASTAPAELRPLLSELLAVLAPGDRSARVEQLFADPPESGLLTLAAALGMLAAPWSPDFARRYLARARQAAGRVASSETAGNDPWRPTLSSAARVLPPEVFADALAPWPVNGAEGASWAQKAWARAIDELTDILRLRQTLWKEPDP
jgi:hypothetical protein